MALFLATAVALAQHPPPIGAITICDPAGTGGQGSCPAGTSDTQHPVLAPDGSGRSINGFNLADVPDQHVSIFSPATLGNNNDYLFFVATGTRQNPDAGAVVLSGGNGPAKNGQWTLDFAKTDGYGSYPSGSGAVFIAPMIRDACPGTPDSTFDLNYAAPGSVVKDPTADANSLFMIYQGSNSCAGLPGGASSLLEYSTIGVATSTDDGHTWPTYRGTSSFAFAPLPTSNRGQGPNAPSGALGKAVCDGNDCSTTPPAAYGRYPVLAGPSPLTLANIGESEPAAFVDDVAAGSTTYLYVVATSTAGSGMANGRTTDLTVARAQLNGGTSPLTFSKWTGSGFTGSGNGGADTPFLPDSGFSSCGTATQTRHSGSISYVEPAQQYLLLFVCDSPGDPAAGQGGSAGSAWFYSTSYNLADPAQWSTPREVTGSWNTWDTAVCARYNGWYPSPMSINAPPGHLSSTGYIFYLWGCEAGAPQPPRIFSSRTFNIMLGVAAPVLTQGTLSNGATYVEGGLVPGSWAQVKGTNLATATRIWGDADFAGLGNKLPTNLSGTQVMVNGSSAAVYFIDPGQISFQVPDGITGTASVQVINNGVSSNTVTAPAATSAPGIFPDIVNGTNYALGVFSDARLIGDPSVNPLFRKAKPGDSIALYATGLTATPADVVTTLTPVSGVTVTLGNVTVPADFAGLVAVGEFQINFTVPQMPAGNYPISIAVNGVSSPSTINSNPPGPLVIPVSN